MVNPFCIPRDKLIRIFWSKGTDDMLEKLFKIFLKRYSLVDIERQIKSGDGEVGEYYKNELDSFSKNNSNNEIAYAIILADFYFRDSMPMICFEMKRGFIKKEIDEINDLFENLECDTEIDCLIKDINKEFKFQLKIYPEEYKKWSVDKFINYLDEAILPERKYNNKSNKNLIIVITFKPELQSNFKEVDDFNEIHKYLKTRCVQLREINFLYNRNKEFIVWYQVYPQNGYYEIPIQNLSHNQAKLTP